MRNALLTTLGKALSKTSQALNRGNGSTWPGHIALKANPNFVRDILSRSETKIIIVAGTNGKTTTSSLIATALKNNGKSVLQNDSGANLLNGIASTILLHTDDNGRLTQDFAILEVDENALPHVLNQVAPDYLVLLNLFRDQLDRYGEINAIAKKWHDKLATISEKTKLILNADDPQIAYLGVVASKARQSHYFGLNETQKKQTQHAADSVSCPKCGSQLIFAETTFSHLGNWHCKHCGLKRPVVQQDTFANYPLSGAYNKYNTNAAVLVLKQVGLKDAQISEAFRDFKPAFGRQEIITYQNRNVQIFLSKNPTSFNQSFATIKELGATTLLLVLNDRIPDGRDVSWIWDTDLTGIEKFQQIIIAGDRVYDMALRVKYEDYKCYKTYEKLGDAIAEGIQNVDEKETLYILPTYSAMLESRKILTGKKIL
ncbi:MAG: MurT ligase domain-containing protein [Candidatus Levyibacteriota bacterium]